jgi:hypothetical protein
MRHQAIFRSQNHTRPPLTCLALASPRRLGRVTIALHSTSIPRGTAPALPSPGMICGVCVGGGANGDEPFSCGLLLIMGLLNGDQRLSCHFLLIMGLLGARW